MTEFLTSGVSVSAANTATNPLGEALWQALNVWGTGLCVRRPWSFQQSGAKYRAPVPATLNTLP
eukprot:363247-Chlamydomonas_euryale.AAC.2